MDPNSKKTKKKSRKVKSFHFVQFILIIREKFGK